MTRLGTFGLAVLTPICAMVGTPASAVVLNVGDSARITFTATTASPPFDFVTFNLMFSQANPFGTNETLSYATFNANNAPLRSASFASGSSIYTSGLFGQLTQNAIDPFNLTTLLTTSSFSVVVTAVTGSFDLTGATGDFQHVLYTAGPSQLGVAGTFTTAAVPEPASWAMMISGFGLIGAAMRRRRHRLTVTFA